MDPPINTAWKTSTGLHPIDTLPPDLTDLIDHEAVRQPSAFG